MAIAVSEAGGLDAVAAAMLTPDTLRAELQLVRQATARSVNVNFFVHEAPAADAEREANWRKRLAPYYRELGLPPDAVVDAAKVPVIAAGGIGDGRGIAAALALGAAGAQIGTGFLPTPEAKTSALHRAALRQAHDNSRRSPMSSPVA